MTPAKRTFDVLLALCGICLLILPGLILVGFLLLVQGRPIFYWSERMKTPDHAFLLWKFRTMRRANIDSGVSGGDKLARITRTGHFLRRSRLDEVPQLWNILRGDMSFVGPRPPLRQYVERFPTLYTNVLQSRPGVTGLATLVFHKREAHLLALCETGAQTDTVYVARCIPRKARLDLIYVQNQTLLLDVTLIMRTIFALRKKRRSA